MERQKRFGVYFIFKSLEQGPKFGIRVPKYPTDDPAYRIVSRQRSRYTHYYFYIRDEVLGPFVMCVGSFLPFQTTYYLNGHHIIAGDLQRQGVRFRTDDNAFLWTADLEALQAAADQLTPERIRERLEYWTLVLGPKFSKKDRAAINLRRAWDFEVGERELRRALALRPSHAQAHIWLAYLLNGTGRHDEAIAEVQRAHVLEPLSPMAATSLGIILGGAGRTDAAIDAYRTSLELDRNYWLTHNWLGMAYRRKGLMQDAINELQRAIDLSSRTPPVVARLGHTYAVAGRHAEALKTIDELIALSKQRWVSPVDIAQIYVALGRLDAAFDWLEKAVNLHDSKLRTIRASGEFARLRSDARFAAVLQRGGARALDQRGSRLACRSEP